MTNIRRYYQDNFTYFVTNVTLNRMPILLKNAELLVQSIKSVQDETNFELYGWVILPDHCHFLIHPDKIDISSLMKRIKLSFSKKYRFDNDIDSGRVWQYRFWDYIIKNQDDMNRHLDYIYINPVKHGLVDDPNNYKYSSIHEYKDDFPTGWGVREKIEIEGEFGE